MAVTLLKLLNDLRRLRRSEKLGSISSSEVDQDMEIALVNDAMWSVLEDYGLWPFDIRRDGFVQFYASKTGTRGSFTKGGTTLQIEAGIVASASGVSSAGDTTVSVDGLSSTHEGFWVGASIEIELDNGNTQTTTITAITPGSPLDVLTIADELEDSVGLTNFIRTAERLDDDDLFPGTLLTRFLATGDGSYSDTSIPVTRIDPADPSPTGVGSTRWELTLAHAFPGSSDGADDSNQSSDGAWRLFACEVELPATVRRMLAAWHQERRLSLDEQDRDTFLQRFMHPLHQHLGENPHTVNVSGSIAATQQAVAATTQGLNMLVWPPPDGDIGINYSYAYRHPEMSDATDEVAGAPDVVGKLIAHKAFVISLGTVEKDPQRAALEDAQLERRILRMLAESHTQTRTWPQTPFGSRRRHSAHPNWRWDDFEIEAPS